MAWSGSQPRTRNDTSVRFNHYLSITVVSELLPLMLITSSGYVSFLPEHEKVAKELYLVNNTNSILRELNDLWPGKENVVWLIGTGTGKCLL